MYALQVAVELLFAFGPYVLAAGAGAYLEAKYGQKAAALAAKELAAAKDELALLRSKI